MNKAKKRISAFTARTNLGRILNEVYYRGSEFIVERFGAPVAQIGPLKQPPTPATDDALERFLSFAGVLSDSDARRMRRSVRRGRAASIPRRTR